MGKHKNEFFKSAMLTRMLFLILQLFFSPSKMRSSHNTLLVCLLGKRMAFKVRSGEIKYIYLTTLKTVGICSCVDLSILIFQEAEIHLAVLYKKIADVDLIEHTDVCQ
jgi:hypothetical protein